MAKSKHIHQYQKETLGKTYKILRCMLPGCSHYIREELGRNRLCLCNRCLEPFVMSWQALTRKKPHCDDCTKVMGFAVHYGKVKHDKLEKKVNVDRLKDLLSADDLMKKINSK